MKLNLRFKICFCAMLLCTVLATKAQTCIGNTFVFPGVPSSCTYTYTTSGWDIIPPTSISSGDSVCILADITTNFDQIDGSIYIAPGVTFTGQINSYETAIIDGTLDLTNSPSITGGDALFISSTGTVNFIGNTTITGPSIIHNNGNLNIIGDLSLTGSSSIIVYEDGHFVVQGNASLTGSNGISNCGIFELVTGTLSSSGDPALQNECTVYINNDFVMSGDYTNNGTTIVNGTIDLNGNDLYNNDLVLVDHLIVDGDNFIGNNTSSVLIVRNNAELINGASITDHFYYDIDDGGGFDTVCGSCTEDITILANVTVPNDQDLIKDDCGANIIPDLHCLISSSTDSDGDGINDSCDLDDDNDGIPDTDELGTIISTEQQPCGGDMSLDFSGTQTLLSGTDLQQGAVYRFSDVHTGPDLDAIVTIVETNNATVVELDRNVTTPESFKPRTGFNFANAGEFGYIEYLIQFVDKGTTNPYTIGKFFMNFNDLDGGSNFGEQNWADNPKTYTIDDPTEVTMNTDGTWIVATGATSDYGPSTNEFPYINFAVNYTNKSEIRIRVGAVARVAGVSSSGRSHSIEFNCVTNYVAPKTYSLDGDFDGLANHLDLDSDNDGILDAVESGHNQSHTNGVLSGPYGTNGLADSVETTPGSDIINYTITDTDGVDGSNYLDIDSDGDTCYDALEGSAGHAYSDINIITGQLNAAIDLNGLPGGSAQGIGTSINNSVLADVCKNSGAMIDFDGIDDYVEVANSVIDGLNEYTISFWYKYDGPAIVGSSQEVFVMGQEDLFEITVRDWGTSQPASEAIGAYIYRTSGLKQGSGWRMTPGDWTHFTVTVSHSGGNTDFKVLRNGFGSGLGTVTTTTNTNSKPFLIGIDESNSYNAFTGAIDELRIFNKVLTDEQIRRMLYQEIKNEGGKVRGTIIDKDIHDDATGDDIDWTELITYYPMSNVNYGKLPDASSYGNDAVLYNITTFQEETAPMPYETVADGAWTDEATWLHGDIWDIESLDTDFGASNQNPEPWSIVKIHHNVTTNTDRRGLGLFIDENKTLSTIGDVSITNNWYLQLDGTIDLVDDSQLIQSEFSDLTTSATGKILRRQEGNSDVYFYNYWSSPVGTMGANSLTDNNAASNNANNSPFNLSMLKDGSGSSFQFTSAFDEAGKISDRWLYNFQNGLTYWDWVTINPSSDITPGFGYSQKGTGNTGLTQQYIFEGKPNNGTILIAADDVDGDDTGVGESIQDISLTTTLIGNPYPSALDAEEFIRDNIDFDNGGANPIIQGTILLWEQWAGNSHWLAEYEGGYGYINLTETARAYQHPDIAISDPTNTDNRGIKTPTKFLPVGQGFFVEVVNDGNIEFNNSQRIFKTEDLGDSVFFRGEQAQNENGSAETSANRADEYEDPMQTIKLELTISNGATRRFVLGFSDHTTDQYDHGYDGGLISQKPDNDMASLINGNPYVIQAFSAMTPEKEIDLYFNSSGDMNYVLDIVELKNIDEGQDIFIRDNRQNLIWNLSSDGAYHFSADAGEDNNRFDIVFSDGATLSNIQEQLNNTIFFVDNDKDLLYIKGLQESAKGILVTNLLGQVVKRFGESSSESLENGIYLGQISSGVYLINLTTETGIKLDKKIIID